MNSLRRNALNVATTLLFASLPTCKGNPESSSPQKQSVVSAKPDAQAIKDEQKTVTKKVEHALFAPIPTFAFSDKGDFGTKKPDGAGAIELDILKDVIDRFLYILKTEGIEGNLYQDLEQRPDERNSVLLHFAQQIPSIFAGMHPDIAAHVKRFHEQAGPNLTLGEAIAMVNEYLIMNGSVMKFDQDEKGAVSFDLYPIRKITYVEVSGVGDKPIKVPVVHVGRGIIETKEAKGKEIQTGYLGYHSPGAPYVLFFDDEIPIATREITKQLSTLSGSKVTVDQQGYIEDILKHESLHAAIDAQYDKVFKIGPTYGYRINFDVPIGEAGASAQFPGVYMPVMLQELCGVGIQLAQSKMNPLLMSQYLSEEKGVSYFLVFRLLPAMMLRAGPENDLKAQITQALMPSQPGSHHTGVDFGVLRDYMKTFSQAQMNEVGVLLYELGIQMIQRAAKGEFEKVDMRRE